VRKIDFWSCWCVGVLVLIFKCCTYEVEGEDDNKQEPSPTIKINTKQQQQQITIKKNIKKNKRIFFVCSRIQRVRALRLLLFNCFSILSLVGILLSVRDKLKWSSVVNEVLNYISKKRFNESIMIDVFNKHDVCDVCYEEKKKEERKGGGRKGGRGEEKERKRKRNC
jgi:hypothetical protein